MAPSKENGSISTGDNKQLTGLLREARQDILSQAGRIIPDLRTLHELSQTISSGDIVDDRKYLIENIIQAAASLPNGSILRDKITDQFIKTLWENLQHPPLSYLGDQFRYRTADGSFNNIMYPRLGASGSHYARSVSPEHPRPAILPDPSVIFDTLLAREGPPKEHPSKISSNLFYLATIIIHDLFHTDESDYTKLKNSSYLDLGPLYGHNKHQQSEVRTFADGLLKPDTFAERRLLSQPPGVSALIIAFNRFHNYVVKEMAFINEGGRFSLPSGVEPDSPKYAQALAKRDNDLFQTGRLVTCGLYVNIILNDYLRAILNLNENPVNSDWKLDPRKSLAVFDQQGLARGVGNQVSAEFNMIYRWHAAISAQDETWIDGLASRVFGPHVDASNLSVDAFLGGLKQYFEANFSGDPSTWTFDGLERGKDGSFADDDLVGLLQDGCENVAAAFGARNIPKVMKAIELLGIQQGRDWQLATLNELRLFFKLKPYSTFAEVNSDPSVAETLEALYGHPDNIELYVGVQTEEAKKPFMPGSGLCPGFTISVAILSDAVALVRGDRFYTVDYNSANLTNFGFNAASSDFDVAGGGVMYKLLMRAFPGWYRPNSVYALYPFATPEKSREIFKKMGKAKEFDFTRPSYIGPPVPVTTWKGLVDLLNDQDQFHVPWGQHTFQLTGHDYMLSGDSSANSEQREFVFERLYRPSDALEEVRQYYESITFDLIQKKSRKIGRSYQVDIVQDVGNLAHAYFCAKFFNIPLKETASSSTDAYTPRELSDALSDLFGYVFLDVDPVQSFGNRVKAARKSKRMGEIMAKAVSDSNGHIISRFFNMFARHAPSLPYTTTSSFLNDYGSQLVKRLLEGGKSVDEVVWTIIPTAAAACATQAQGWGQMLDVYLSDKYASQWPAIRKLAQSEEPEAFEKLKKYALEGFRLSTPAFGVLRTSMDNTTIKDGKSMTAVKTGDTIFVDFVTAGQDPSKFPDPEEIRLDRPPEVYIHHGWGPHSCLGRAIVTTAGASLLRVLGRLGNIRRAPGPAGEMKSKFVNKAFKVYLPEDGSEWTPFPCSEYSSKMASFYANPLVYGNPFLDIPSDMDTNPFRWVWEDICSVFSLARLLPRIFLPLGPLKSEHLDELYPDLRNLRDISLHVILIVIQVVLLLSFPLVLMTFWAFPLVVYVVFYVLLTLVTMIIMRLLNGPPTGRSLIGVPKTKPPANNASEPWFFINGVATGRHWHLSNLALLAEIFGREIVGIHNPTKGLILDLIECLIQRDLDYKTIDIRQGRAQLRAALAASTTKRAVLIVHSQGGIEAASIIDWLFGELSHDKMRKLEVYTFGNAARQFRNPPIHDPVDEPRSGRVNPRRQTHGERVIRYIEHYANSKDFVANIGVLKFTTPVAAYSNGGLFSGSVFVRVGSGHLLNMHYLDPMFGEDSAFMRSMVDIPSAEGAEGVVVVSKPVRELSRLYQYRNGESPKDPELD
ncbi:heme peroxidase family protein [Aspergillus ochraceoroseus]|uniref:Heme peroxidase family protein n=2 Tax=Aspergillus ochraceoroseus TaxID=138278 RepID=A0A0F8WKJ2_9EURO|nr:heme peroxidase family protein [Aspergillus ochraceoroseus]